MWKWKKWFGRGGAIPENIDSAIDYTRLPQHIAIIMDGNGRWAQKKGLPRTLGHRAGAETLRTIVKVASDIGVKALTTYAFSTENWKRPSDEVSLLMNLISDYLDNEIQELGKNNVQVRFIGKTHELSQSLQDKIEKAQAQTAGNTGMILNLAINYGGRAEILRAVQIISQKVLNGDLTPEQITETTIQENLYTVDLPAPDLLIRPSGDYRISNFLLWQMAYTEFWFSNINWPDFKPEHLVQAITEFQQRERRFGGIKNTKKR